MIQARSGQKNGWREAMQKERCFLKGVEPISVFQQSLMNASVRLTLGGSTGKRGEEERAALWKLWRNSRHECLL